MDSRLQGEHLFLYFMQFGKCAYSGMPIELEKLMSGSKEYDIDHIYPQAYVKDDSIINNKVLVLSKINGTKGNVYPISPEIRNRMQGQWNWWHHIGVISDEKYKRLIRSTPFTDDEKYGFINRQLTETSQSTKLIAGLLKERFQNIEIVYVKAGLVSDFRHEFDLPKSRTYNDLHHAVDAYLNIVAGNVYNMRFSKRWFSVDSKYSIKTKTVFSHPVNCQGTIVWEGASMLAKVKKIAKKNTAHFVKFATFKTGGLFDQNPVKKGTGLIPLKAGLPTEKYGGYNSARIMFFIPVKYKLGKKNEIIIMSVELLHGKHFLEDETFAKKYSLNRLESILGKKVDEVNFPLGMRPWKVNTMLSFQGFRACITGTQNNGKILLLQTMQQFMANEEWKLYIKKLDNFVEKNTINPNYLYDQDYDLINVDANIKLYDLYISKLQTTVYKNRMNIPIKTLSEGQKKFKNLNILQQSQILLNIHSLFGRLSGGCDLTAIGGSKNCAKTTLNSSISNWKKLYADVRIIDQSPSGIWEKRSENILELL